MSNISDKEVLRNLYDTFNNDTTSPRGDQGEVIVDLGSAVARNWTAQTDSRRLLRQRFEAKNGDPLIDTTFDVDSAEVVHTSYDYPPRK